MTKEYYQKNKDKIKLKSKIWSKNNKQKSLDIKRKSKNKNKLLAKEYVESYKSKCCYCNLTDKNCLEFHHIKNKKYNISKMVLSGYSVKLIKLELQKCECICANCHRKKHFKNYESKHKKHIFVKNIKSLSKCEICNENYIACLDFHHIDPSTKVLNIGAMIRDKQYSILDIDNEIKKCKIICVNCHRKLH